MFFFAFYTGYATNLEVMLSWRHECGMSPSSQVFDGSSDVRVFPVFFAIVAMREKKEEDKRHEFLGLSDGRALEFFFEQFTEGGEFTANLADSLTVKAVLEAFEEREDRQEIILMALSGTIDSINLTNSMCSLDLLFTKAESNKKAKFGLLRTNKMRVPGLCSVAMYRSP